MRRRRQEGFTLIELLIVVAVIGIIASIAIPNLLNAIQRGKQKRTVGDLRSVATALESYAIDHGSYPNVTGLTSGLRRSLQPNYMKMVPVEDGWGHTTLYSVLDPAADGGAYILWSLGKDGQDDGNNGDDGETHSLNADIVIFDGQFTQWPEGTQH